MSDRRSSVGSWSNSTKVQVALRTLLSAGDRAEDDHPHRVERANNVIDDLGDPIPNRAAIPQPVDVAGLLAHAQKCRRIAAGVVRRSAAGFGQAADLIECGAD